MYFLFYVNKVIKRIEKASDTIILILWYSPLSKTNSSFAKNKHPSFQGSLSVKEWVKDETPKLMFEDMSRTQVKQLHLPLLKRTFKLKHFMLLTRARRGYARPKIPCQLISGRKKPSETRMAAMLMMMVPLGPWGMVMWSLPSSPSHSPCVYLTATALSALWYVLELKKTWNGDIGSSLINIILLNGVILQRSVEVVCYVGMCCCSYSEVAASSIDKDVEL